MEFLSPKFESYSLGFSVLLLRADIKDFYRYFFCHLLPGNAGNKPDMESPFAVRHCNSCRSAVGHYYLVSLVSGIESQYQGVRTCLTVPTDLYEVTLFC